MTGKAVWSEGGRGREGRLVRGREGQGRPSGQREGGAGKAVWSEGGRDREGRLVRGRK